MLWFRNLLITFGAFWLSSLLAVPLTALFIPINNRLIYGDSFPAATMMGMMVSMGTAIAAAFGAALVMFSSTNSKPIPWTLILTLLFALRHLHYHWVVAPAAWGPWWLVVVRLWPAVACLFTAVLIARVRGQTTAVEKTD